MTRAYIRLDPAFDERKAHYPDGPYAALVATMCLAEHQPERGRFRSAAYLRALLDKRGRHLPYLIQQGDLVKLDDGRLYLDGWDEWQEGDWKVAERVARIRERKRRNVSPRAPSNGPGNADGNGADRYTEFEGARDALLELSVSGGADRAETEQGEFSLTEEAPEDEAVTWLANHGIYLQPHGGYYRQLLMTVERHGINAVVGMLDRLASHGMPDGDTAGYVFGVRDALDKQKRPDLRALEREERVEEQGEDFRRRVERTQLLVHENGGHADTPNPACPKCREVAA